MKHTRRFTQIFTFNARTYGATGGCSRLYSPCSSSLPLSSEKCPFDALDGLLVPFERPFPKYSEPLSIIPGIAPLKVAVFQLLCRGRKCQQELKDFLLLFAHPPQLRPCRCRALLFAPTALETLPSGCSTPQIITGESPLNVESF